MQLYFVRHGRTQYNIEKRFQGGSADSPLVESGIAGAIAAGNYLKQVQFSQVYSSPQGRALDTAKLITAENQWQPTIIVEPRFSEFDFGRWDGQLEKDVEPKDQLDKVMHQPEAYDPALANGGETYAAFVARTTASVHDVVTKAGVDNPNPVLIVSHGLVTTMTIKTLMGVPVSGLRAPFVVDGKVLNTVGHGIVDNDSLTIVETTDNQNFKLKTWNETGYLSK